ncbi:MAG: hypothetical protein WD883_00835 [Candidatus Colwellbacteria bacterium]
MNNIDHHKLYALAERYAAGESASVLAQALGGSSTKLLAMFKENLPAVVFERVIKARLRVSKAQRFQSHQSSNVGIKKWTLDNLTVQGIARLYLDGRMTLKEISREFGVKSTPQLRYMLESAFGEDLFRKMMEKRSARIDALGRRSAKAGHPRPSKWTADNSTAIELLTLYEQGMMSVTDIAARFGFASETAAVTRIIKSAFGVKRYHEAKAQREVNLALRGVDPQVLARAYVEAKESKTELAHKLLGVKRESTLDRALELALGKERLDELKEQRRQASRPGPKPGFDASYRRKWTPDSPYVQRIVREYLVGEKTVRQIALENGLEHGPSVHYGLRKAYGDEEYAKLKDQRQKAKKPRPRGEEDT